ncbi:transmembrane protein, putative (macronuclear) [Tetrahymena thermophila SB210]|uniref:Transmembrane protein, putative n=1 Tax=Tetrahymena thermophila (strain SB210) TaxID=312017 RepID=Q23R50_TETTS|nr:transmembrane protein, putative [Tetrahymena thermophila SB210]EAR98991.2 transmembrane protein, putative [Tetrahymena thermophila SB210]|eukprot:XP_001019236.2 transmembrane protein, putative [Tetrahymena thermophila SB210]
MNKEDITKNDLLNDNYRRQYLIYYIQQIYKNYLHSIPNRQIDNQIYSGYIAFVIDGLENQSIAFREILIQKSRKYKQSTFLQKQRILYFLNLAIQKFRNKQLNNQNKINLFSIIEFDQVLEQSQHEYYKCLLKKLELIKLIGVDFINLQSFEKEANQLFFDRQRLYEKLFALQKCNPNNQPLQIICEGYDECLSIQKTFQILYQQQNNNKGKFKKSIPFYSEDAAVAYISMQTNIGKIIKVSSNFSQVVPLVKDSKQAIGKNINFMQPEQIALVHQNILQNCLDKKTLSEEIKDYPLILAKDQNGWAIPYHVKIQMCMIGFDELGASGWLKQIIDNNIYLMSSSVKNNLKIFLVDQNFFKTILQDIVLFQDIKKINLSSIIPLINLILEKGIQGQFYEVLAIKPQDFNDAMKQRDYYDEKLIQDLLEMNLYKIKFTFYNLNNQFIQFIQYQITSITPIYNFSQKREAIKNFKAQIIQFVDFQQLKVTYEEVIKSQISINQDLLDNNNGIKSSHNISIEEAVFSMQDQPQFKDQNQELINIDLSSINSKFPSQKSIRDCKSYQTLTYETRNKQQSVKYSSRSNIQVKNKSQQRLNSFSSQQSIFSQQNHQQIENVLYPQNTVDTHRSLQILSIESFTSPINSGRKPILFQEQAKQALTSKNISHPILENSQEEENLSFKIQEKKKLRNLNFFPQQKIDQQKYSHPLTLSDPISSNQQPAIRSNQNIIKEEIEKDVSVSTTLSAKSSVKAYILSNIKSKTNSKKLKIINIFGIVCIAIITLVNIIAFIYQAEEFYIQKQNYEQIFWCFELKRFTSLIQSNRDLLNSLISGYYTFNSELEGKRTYGYIKIVDMYLYESYKNLTVELVQTKAINIDIFTKANEYQVQHFIPNSLEPTQITAMSTPLTFKLLFFQYYSYLAMYDTSPIQYNALASKINDLSLSNELQNVYDSNTQIFYSFIDQSRQLVTIQLYCISIITAFICILVIPIYYQSQKKKENILKLFAVFTQEQIKQMLQAVSLNLERYQIQFVKKERTLSNMKLELYSSYHRNQISDLQLKPQNNQSIIQSKNILVQTFNLKKKSISSTSTISKFSLNLILGILACLALNQFYPVSNYIIQMRQIDYFQQNLDFLNEFNFFVDNITIFIKLRYVITYQYFSKAPQAELSAELENLKSTHDIQKQLFQKLIETFSKFESFDGYEREQYQNYLSKVFKSNICDTIFDPNQNHFRDIQISYEVCKQIKGGIFQKGLIVSFKDLIGYNQKQKEGKNQQQNNRDAINEIQIVVKYFIWIGRYDITKEDIFGIEYRKQYLDYYILNSFRDQIKNNKLEINRFYYSYITFCVNALKNQMISFKEILTMRQIKYNKVNLRHKQAINYLYDLACEEFEIDAQMIQNSNHEKIIDVIDYDESLEQCSKEYRQCLNLKYDLLQTIGHDYIKLHMLEQQASSLQQKRQLLIDELNKLFQKNSSSAILQNICEGLEECLIIEPIFTKKYEQQRKSGYFHKNKIPLYTENSAAIYITLLTDIGKILKVSKNFKDVVPLVQNNLEAIGKNISFMQPDEIAQGHNQILMSSLERKSFNFSVKNYPIIIGKNAQGWSIPYHIKIQLCMLGNFELGACGWIKQIKDGCMYILTSMAKDDFKVMTMDQTIYQIMLQGYFSRSQIKGMRLKNIIPMLQAIIEKGQQGQTYETIVVQPYTIQDTIQERDICDEKIINQLFKSNLFNMKFSFYTLVNPHVSFTIFQISSFKPLDDLHNKKEALKNFKIQIYDYMDPKKLTANIAQSFNSLNLIQDQSQELVKTAQNINIQQSQIISLQNIKNEHKNEESNQFIQNQTTQESSLIKEYPKQTKEKQIDVNQSTKPKPFLNQIMETSNEHCNLENTPGLDFKKPNRISIDCIEPLNNKQKDGNLKLTQMDSGTSRQHNLSEQLVLGLETQSFATFTNQLKSIGQNAQDSTPQILSVETHHLFSSDSLFFSPLSSNRKLLQNPEVSKTLNSKVDLNQISSPIVENSFEEEQGTKNNQNSISYNTSMNKNYLQYQSKNLSIQNNLTNVQKSENNNQSHSHSGNTSKNVDKKTQDEKALFEEKDKEGSVKTGKTSRSTARQQIISTIRSKNNSYSVRFINYLGIFCIFVICVLNMASFFVQYNDQKQQKLNFEKIAWCFQIKRYISFAFGNIGLMNGIGVKLYQFQSPLQMGAFVNYVLEQNKLIFQKYKNSTNELIQGDLQDIYVFSRVNSYQINISFANVMDQSQITYMPTILTQKLTQFQQNIYYTTSMLDQNNLNYGQLGINYNDIYIALDSIYNDNKQHFFDQVDTSKTIITIQLIIISIITGLFFILIIPIYTYSMYKKEEILKLFATIPAEKIILMMMKVSKYIDKQEQMDIINQKSKNVVLSSLNHIDKYLKNNTNLKFSVKQIQQFSSNQIVLKKPIDNMKKKNISSTNSIHKINLLLFAALIIFLVMTIFYPICNYIITISQVNNFTNILKFLNSFDYFIDNLISQYSIKCGYTFAINMAMFFPDGYLDTYIQVAQSYTSTTQQLLDDMVSNYQIFQTQNGYNQDSYNNFFYPFFKDDVCNVVFQTGQNHLRDVSLTFDQCKQSAQGVFSKGYLVAIKTITNMLDTYFEVAYTKNVTLFNSMNYQLQQQLPIDKEYKFILDFLDLGDVLHNFFQDIYSNYHDYVLYLQIFLVSLQILTIFFVMAFAWRSFYNFLSKTYYKTKQLLDLIEVNTILDNPYMVSYFKKNK